MIKNARRLPDPVPMTKAGYDKVVADIERLTLLRAEILIRLQAAREMGDLSENGAYHAAKFELGNTDRELRRLSFLKRFGVIEESEHTGKVDFGSTVTVKSDKGEMTFMLVSKYESDPMKKMLSVNSPFGRAVLHRKKGDEIVVHTPAGDMNYTIVEVK